MAGLRLDKAQLRDAQRSDLHEALEEHRAAHMLDPEDATYKQNYESLLQQVNQ